MNGWDGAHDVLLRVNISSLFSCSTRLSATSPHPFHVAQGGLGQGISSDLRIESTAYGSLEKRHFAFAYSGFLFIVTFPSPP